MEKLIFIALIYCIPNFDKEMYSSRSVHIFYLWDFQSKKKSSENGTYLKPKRCH